jgi:hypothetical protein
MATAAEDTWVGWYRPSTRTGWRLICSGVHEKTCWLRLLHAQRGSGQFAVLAADADPDEAPAGMLVGERKLGRSLLPSPGAGKGQTQ